MNNIFLTGEVGVGKSTVIRKALKLLAPIVCGGFYTVSTKCANQGDMLDVYIEKAWENTPHDLAHLVGTRTGTGRFASYPQAFDNAGVKILSSTPIDAAFIIMDELGVMESDAELFKNTVLNMLDGPLPILGVIKNKQSDFLNKIRSHQRSVIIEVTAENRDALPPQIKNYF